MRVSYVFRKHIALLILAFASVSPSLLLASDRDTGTADLGFPHPRSIFYGELHFGAAGIRHSDLDFFPLFASATAGVFVVPNVGIEIFADAALADEDNAGFDMELSSAQGIAARFQSPPRGGLSGYIVLGMVNYTLTQTPQNALVANGKIEEDFRGARISVGLVQQLRRVPELSFSAEYRSYYADQPIKVDSLVFGVRLMP